MLASLPSFPFSHLSLGSSLPSFGPTLTSVTHPSPSLCVGISPSPPSVENPISSPSCPNNPPHPTFHPFRRNPHSVPFVLSNKFGFRTLLSVFPPRRRGHVLLSSPGMGPFHSFPVDTGVLFFFFSYNPSDSNSLSAFFFSLGGVTLPSPSLYSGAGFPPDAGDPLSQSPRHEVSRFPLL